MYRKNMYESNFSIYCFLLMNHISSKCNKNLEIITLLIHILSIFIILDCSFPLSCVLVEKQTSLFQNNSGYQRLQFAWDIISQIINSYRAYLSFNKHIYVDVHIDIYWGVNISLWDTLSIVDHYAHWKLC